MKQLSCEEAKRIDMVDYLSSLNHQPQKISNQGYWYLSPLRQERTASFKVNRTLNVWFDFGAGSGGDFIEFGTRHHTCTVSDLLKKFANIDNKSALSFQPPHLQTGAPASSPDIAGEKKESADSKIELLDSRPLQSAALLGYLNKRCIPLDIASIHCREVDFLLYGKQHTVIGFLNNAGGHELRNENFKGCSSPKEITFIDNNTPRLAV